MLNLFGVPLRVYKVDFLLFLFFVVESIGPADEVSVLNQYVAVSFEHVATVMRPSFKQLCIERLQCCTSTDFYQLFEDVVPESDHKRGVDIYNFRKIGVIVTMTRQPEASGNYFL